MGTTSSQTMDTFQFRACSGDAQGFGNTPGEALAALMTHLPGGEPPAPIVIFPFNRGDAFFTDAQQARLRDLKMRRETLTLPEQGEWEQLVAAAFDATLARTQTLQNVKA